MLAELLVAYTCISGFDGCSKSQRTYLHYHPEVQQMLDVQTRKIANLLPKYVAKDILPLIALAQTKKLTLTISETTSMSLKEDELSISYGIDFP